MKFKLAAFFAFFAFLCSLANVSAQAEDQVSVRVDLVAWGQPIQGLSLKSASGQPHAALSFTYTKSIPYSGPALMEIHQSGASPPEVPAGEKAPAIPPALLERRKQSPTLVALAPIPSGARRVTVLLAPAPGGVFQAYVINCDPSKVPVGKLSVLNLSPYKIAMRFAGAPQQRQLAPNAALIANPLNQQVVYELAYLDAEEWITQESNILPVPNEDQTLMIVLKSDSELFRSSFGGVRGFLQLVTLRRGPGEPDEVILISEAEQEAAKKEAERTNRDMEEQAKPQQERKQPAQP